MTATVAVVGSANADLVVEVPRRPGGGETILGSDLMMLAGGKGANQAAATGRSGAEVTFVACLGDDLNAMMLREKLQEAGVDLSGVQTGTQATGTAIIFLTPDGENSIVVAPGANQELTVEALDEAAEHWRGADVVVLSLEIPHPSAFHVARAAAAEGSRVVLNSAPASHLPDDVLRLCNPLIVNEHEALEALGVGEDDPDAEAYDRLATRLLEAGALSVVITLGGEGAIIADNDGMTNVAAHKVDAVDTTGAGDAFVGAVAAELSHGKTLTQAVEFGNAMAAVAVQKVGAQSSYPDRSVVEEFIASRA